MDYVENSFNQKLYVGDEVVCCVVEGAIRRLVKRTVTDVGFINVSGRGTNMPYISCDNSKGKMTNLECVYKINTNLENRDA